MSLDYGYMEDDHLGKVYDLALLARLVRFARPYFKGIFLAMLLALLTIALELLLPYLTRQGIDRYILNQAVQVELNRLPADLVQPLEALPRQWREGSTLYAPDYLWRGLDPALIRQVQERDALSEKAWYIVSPEVYALAKDDPQLFKEVDGQYLLRVSDFTALPAELLHDLRWPDVKGLIGLAVIYMLTSVLSLYFSYHNYMILERGGQRMMLALRGQLFRHIISRAAGFFAHNPVGKLVTRLTNDIQNLNELYATTLMALIKDVFMLVGITLALLWLDWRLALCCLALAPVISLLAWFFSRLSRNAFRELQGQVGRMNARLTETLNGLNVIKLLKAQAEGETEFRRLNESHFKAGMKQVRAFAFFMPLTELFSSLAIALIIWYGGGEVVQDNLSLGTLVAFIAYMQMFFRPIRDLAEKYNILQSAMSSAERIFYILDDDQALPQSPQPVSPQATGPPLVSFEDVSFSYLPDRPVLRRMSFSIPPGQTWAVVGPTGAGKTSLLSLLMRFYDPDQGRIWLDGYDLRTLKPEYLSRRMALVSQETFLSSGTIWENITLGRPWVTSGMVEQALEVSGAGKFVKQMEQGLQTRLGEGARRLSAGQRQLLALARALAGEPGMLILDEATSSVDPESERLLQAALPQALRGRTCLVVAHRLTTVHQAHNILVLRKGIIAEQGNHQQLMQLDGLYARLVRWDQLRNVTDQP